MERTMKIVIGNDHAATELKFEIAEYLKGLGHEVVNIGTDSTESCNYPEYGEKVGRMVAAHEADCGVLICGTGVGISIAANKVPGVRAAVCSDTATARLKVGRMVAAHEADCGVLICGTGVGISIAANKVPGVRAAVCSDTATARLVKEHNNANIIAFGARIVGSELAKDIVKAYLDAEFAGGRHQTRIDMIHEIEKKNIAK